MNALLSSLKTAQPIEGPLAEIIEVAIGRLERGLALNVEAFAAAHTEYGDELRELLPIVATMVRLGTQTADMPGSMTEDSTRPSPSHSPPRGGEYDRSSRLEVRCPNCHQPTQIAFDTTLTDLTCSACGSHFSLVDQSETTQMAPSLLKMGRFELIERVGVGGFGSVWKARDKELDRTVAVKIPRAGAMTGAEQEKFFREARAAAQLRHPSIVSVHEVGRDGDSVYIVSDFVRGVTLFDWLTGQQATGREAAEMCAKIAEALHHAHEHGVIHRDLKPANIMIDGDGSPHLMDFGLARREVGEVTVTMDGQVLGTPAYMSPEQAQGEAHTADRRSDVYSLGVVLFHLLTGELPFRGNARMLMHQVIHDEPPSPRKLNANIKKDLETITLKCLEKAPDRRFQTALEVSEELQRFLRGEPIHARPIGRAERGVRWVRRNKTVAAISALAATALLAGTIVSIYFAVSARRQADLALMREAEAVKSKQEEELARRDAEARQKESEAVNKFLTDTLSSAHPAKSGRNVTVAEMLDRAEKDLDKLADQPLTQAALLHGIGASRIGLGLWPDAARVLKQASELREKGLGRENPATLISMENYAYALTKVGRLSESTELYKAILEVKKKTRGPNHAATLGTMTSVASNYRQMHRAPEAIEMLNGLLAEQQRTFGGDNATTQVVKLTLADCYRDTGEFDKAISLREEYLAEERTKGPVTVDTLGAMAGLAATYHFAGKYDDAIALYKETIAAQKEKLGVDHPDTVNSISMLAWTYRKAGRVDDSIPLYEEVLDQRRKSLGLKAPATTLAANALVIAYEQAGRLEQLQKLFGDLLAADGDNPQLLNSIAWTLASSKLEKVRNGKRAVEIATKACELTKYKDPAMLDTLAAAFAENHDFDNAVKWKEKTLEIVGPGKGAMSDSFKKAVAQYKARKAADQAAPSATAPPVSATAAKPK
jgi:tetratricopeptide (TPR) repeat protein/ribosomal protein S27E